MQPPYFRFFFSLRRNRRGLFLHVLNFRGQLMVLIEESSEMPIVPLLAHGCALVIQGIRVAGRGAL